MSAKHLFTFSGFFLFVHLLLDFYFKTSKALGILSTLTLDFLAKDVFDY